MIYFSENEEYLFIAMLHLRTSYLVVSLPRKITLQVLTKVLLFLSKFFHHFKYTQTHSFDFRTFVRGIQYQFVRQIGKTQGRDKYTNQNVNVNSVFTVDMK